MASPIISMGSRQSTTFLTPIEIIREREGEDSYKQARKVYQLIGLKKAGTFNYEFWRQYRTKHKKAIKDAGLDKGVEAIIKYSRKANVERWDCEPWFEGILVYAPPVRDPARMHPILPTASSSEILPEYQSCTAATPPQEPQREKNLIGIVQDADNDTLYEQTALTMCKQEKNETVECYFGRLETKARDMGLTLRTDEVYYPMMCEAFMQGIGPSLADKIEACTPDWQQAKPRDLYKKAVGFAMDEKRPAVAVKYYSNQGGKVQPQDKSKNKTRKCYNCGKVGHLAKHCRCPKKPCNQETDQGATPSDNAASPESVPMKFRRSSPSIPTVETEDRGTQTLEPVSI
ncbi:uncharacterized protein [Eleutherodactylus coqui]|uniref:uncharacterized protein n=1 Tax=Eleutherodactylus coqui TaxID=57060 RepID=UPI0034634402